MSHRSNTPRGPGDRYITNTVSWVLCDGQRSNREPAAAERERYRPSLRADPGRIDSGVVW